MRLSDKARGLHKQAVLGGLVASHIGQNLVGRPIAKSKWFKKDVAKAGVMGALGKQSPRSAKGYGKDALMGVVAPEVNAAKNTAYTESRKKARELHNRIRKTESYKKARAAQKASGGDLKLPMDAKRELVKARKKLTATGAVSKKEIKDIQNLPKGSRAPSSTKAAIGANVALAAVPGGQSTALVNAAKLGTGTNAYSKSKLGKKLNQMAVEKPVKDAYDKGVKGGTFSNITNNAKSVGMNPFTAEAERLANKAGKEVKKKSK